MNCFDIKIMLRSNAVDGNIDAIKYIFKRYYNLIDKYDYVPLEFAHQFNNVDIVKFLLKHEFLRRNIIIRNNYSKYSTFWKQIVDEIVLSETIKKNLKQLKLPEDIILYIQDYLKT